MVNGVDIQVIVEVLRGDHKEKIPVILEPKPDESWWYAMQLIHPILHVYIHFTCHCHRVNEAVLWVFFSSILLHKQLQLYIYIIIYIHYEIHSSSSFYFLTVKHIIICLVYFAPIQFHTRGMLIVSHLILFCWNGFYFLSFFFLYVSQRPQSFQLKQKNKYLKDIHYTLNVFTVYNLECKIKIT